MGFLESVRLALDNVRVNKMRSILTMLGIIIGISSVITITTIGTSLKSTISASLSKFGSINSIYCNVEPYYPETDAEWDTWVMPDMTDEDMLKLEDISDLKAAFPDIIKNVVSDGGSIQGKATGGVHDAKVSLSFTTGGNIESLNLTKIAGRDINLRDNIEERAVGVVSDLFVKYYCGGKSPIGQRIEVQLDDNSVYRFYVVGIYRYDKIKFGMVGGSASSIPEKDIATAIYTPMTIGDAGTKVNITNFEIITKSGIDSKKFSEDLKTYFDEGKYKGNENFHIGTFNAIEQLGQINQIISVISLVISIIAAISLIVGGIGVMNIMLVSVVERTREIGIRKALGARPRVIRRQFLMESVVICIIGGILGIIIGLILGYIFTIIGGQILQSTQPELNGVLTVAFRPSIVAIFVSALFSMLVGVIFGSYPAKRAAKLNPIDALRYE